MGPVSSPCAHLVEKCARWMILRTQIESRKPTFSVHLVSTLGSCKHQWNARSMLLSLSFSTKCPIFLTDVLRVQESDHVRSNFSNIFEKSCTMHMRHMSCRHDLCRDVPNRCSHRVCVASTHQENRCTRNLAGARRLESSSVKTSLQQEGHQRIQAWEEGHSSLQKNCAGLGMSVQRCVLQRCSSLRFTRKFEKYSRCVPTFTNRHADAAFILQFNERLS